VNLVLALVAAGLAGFISLSYEILWYRAISIVSGATAAAFGLLLGFYLLGLAVGAWLAGRKCERLKADDNVAVFRGIAWFFLAANVMGFLVLPGFASFAGWGVWPVALPLVTIAAGMFGAVFPLVSHFAVRPEYAAGRQVSWMYAANIVGCVAGSFLTGFMLLDVLRLQGVAVVLAVLGCAAVSALLLITRASWPWFARSMATIVLVGGVTIVGGGAGFDRFYERLQFGRSASERPRFAQVVENRSGVITVATDGTVYGNGAYDGKVTTDLVHDRNMIIRAYAIGGLHPAPRHVLMIGMGGGAWAQVVAHLPGVESLTIVEINPGYLEVLQRHQEVRSLLTNPMVKIVIDDGRRWLNRHPDRKFDLVVSNTSQHWRAHATHLLSQEFLAIVRRHLEPNGVYYFNTTYSHAALKTAMTAFPRGVLVINFAAVGDSVRFDRDRFRRVIANYAIDGHRLFRSGSVADARRLEAVLDLPVVDRGQVLRGSAFARIVTDDNMETEWHRSPERWQ
jgi:spermidine synthase